MGGTRPPISPVGRHGPNPNKTDEGRERLVRYCARPCFAVERLSILRDARVAYQVKYPRRKGTHWMMTPIVFLARLAALVPPPRHPLVRYHGVLAPHVKQRSVVVPKATAKACNGDQRAGADSAGSDDKKTTNTPMPTRPAPKRRARAMAKLSRRGDERSEAAPSAVSERGARHVAVGALLTMVHGEVERERVSTALGAVLPWADVGFVSEGIWNAARGTRRTPRDETDREGRCSTTWPGGSLP
ncbi:transposase [Sorangium sp. So ce117]|uniref:transposase n=1 Tax=Sorangium sp. So ce117 TaxID=3133277 RepID=UPI003F60F610